MTGTPKADMHQECHDSADVQGMHAHKSADECMSIVQPDVMHMLNLLLCVSTVQLYVVEMTSLLEPLDRAGKWMRQLNMVISQKACISEIEMHVNAMNCISASHHCLLTVLREVKDGVSIFVIQVIEEDAATASALVVAVLDHKVIITPLLELGPVFWIMLITYSLHPSKPRKSYSVYRSNRLEACHHAWHHHSLSSFQLQLF